MYRKRYTIIMKSLLTSLLFVSLTLSGCTSKEAPIETINQSLYISEKNGIQFSYPSDWVIEEDENDWGTDEAGRSIFVSSVYVFSPEIRSPNEIQ